MERYDEARPAGGDVVHDRHWAGDVRVAVRCAAGLFTMLLLIDAAAGGLTWWRGALWAGLAVLLFLVLVPARVSAGEGWLASRRLLRTRRVRTDLLVSVYRVDGVSRRLVLRDTFGGRVEVDPRTLIDDPRLWYRVAEDARRSLTAGGLLYGATALRRIEDDINGETAHTVFRVSGLD
ncbi:hypothetical protein AB0F77_37055 [Streptomyces sp. NPDC026672]|uniref:hypothetical protein n=1 Tax=unclassified Streptomyces TaxID=2593676 RepID=UPI0033DFCB23